MVLVTDVDKVDTYILLLVTDLIHNQICLGPGVLLVTLFIKDSYGY